MLVLELRSTAIIFVPHSPSLLHLFLVVQAVQHLLQVLNSSAAM
jgi:hypothetical protein